jgi:hypothetical protein
MFELKRTPFHERTSKLCLPQNWWRFFIALSGGSATTPVEAFFAPAEYSLKVADKIQSTQAK